MKKLLYIFLLLAEACEYPSERFYGTVGAYVGVYNCGTTKYYAFELFAKDSFENIILETDTLNIGNIKYDHVYLVKVNNNITYINFTPPLIIGQLYITDSKNDWSREMVNCPEAKKLNVLTKGVRLDKLVN